MKRFKATAMSMLLALSVLPSAWAAITDAPLACPNVDALKKGGLFGVQEDKTYNLYLTYQISKYDTSSIWAFGIGVPTNQATSKSDALNKGRAALVSLSGNPQPVAVNSDNKQWYCMYENEYHYLTAAFTPLTVSTTMNTVFSVNK